MKHKHHIIPRHMGGSDDPSNIVELTIEEHAEAHRILYEQYGKLEDKLAWMGLSNMISKKEIIYKLLTKPKSEEWKQKNRKPKVSNKNYFGNKNAVGNNKPKSEEHKLKIAQAHKGMEKTWLKGNTYAAGPHPKRTCPHCGKIGGGPNMTRYHFEKCKWKS